MDTPSPHEMLEAQYALRVHNHTPLYGPWTGWRLAGRDLVSPDGTRFSPQRLRGLAWRQDASTRLERAAARNAKKKPAQLVRVVVVDLAVYRDGQARLAG